MIQARRFETRRKAIFDRWQNSSVSFHFQEDPRNASTTEHTCSPSKTFLLAMTREDRIHVHLTIFKHLKSSVCLTLVSLSTRAPLTLLRNPTNVHISETWRNMRASRKKQHEHSWIKFYCLPTLGKFQLFGKFALPPAKFVWIITSRISCNVMPLGPFLDHEDIWTRLRISSLSFNYKMSFYVSQRCMSLGIAQ